ncbi:MAG: hypothetical protein WC050_02230 [Candidatus Paceibacterota bacterium]
MREDGIGTENDPDLYVRSYTQFGIDEARELRERASSRALGTRRAFIVAAPSLTNEAQNALLKTLEEPPGDAIFFFIVASPESMLATLRSRSQTLSLGSDERSGIIDVSDFLSSNPALRLDMLKPLFEKDEDDRRDMSSVLIFLSSLERMLAQGRDRSHVAAGAEAIYRARAFISDKGALVKPLLEQVALLVPQIKEV